MPFSPAFLAKQKERLLQEKAQLERDLSDIANRDPKDPQHFQTVYPESQGTSEDDNAAETAEYADELSIEKRLEAELRDTIHALEAMKNGTYGFCKYCHREIDEKRLEARPSAATCITCKKSLTKEM